jgi:hypothetical protein
MHVREAITQAVVTAITSLTTTGANVYRDRDTDEHPLKETEVPGLIVTDDDGERIETVSLGVSRLLDRHMPVHITAHVKASSGYSSDLNKILKELETALGSTAALGGAKSVELTSVGGRESSRAGEKAAVRQTFTFEFFYVTAHNAPDVAL